MKVLLLDPAFGAAPIYDALLAQGHTVWVMGNRPWDVLARRAGARWIEADYSDLDAVRACVATHGIERVVPGCTDVSLNTASDLAHDQGYDLGHDLGLSPEAIDAPDIRRQLAEKDRFRALCARLDLPSPRRIAPEALPVPGKVICKPVDAFSGRGITVVNGADPQACAAAIATAEAHSPSGRCLLEEFFTGQMMSCSAFLQDGTVALRHFVHEASSVNPFAVDTSYVDLRYPVDRADTVVAAIETMARALGLVDGLFHVQFIDAPDGPVLIEVMRRCPGDLYSLLIQMSTGQPYAARYAASFLGTGSHSGSYSGLLSGLPPQDSAVPPRYILRHTVSSPHEAVYAGLQLDPPQTVRAFVPLCPIGTPLEPMQKTRAGLLFVEYPDFDALLEGAARFVSRQAYSLDAPWT